MTRTGRAVAPGGVGLWWRLDGDGPAVLLVPGRGDSTDVFPDDISDALLAAGCAVLRMDPRDTGLSDDGGHAYTFATMGDDVRTVMAAAGATTVHLVALSMGGMIAVDLAVRNPRRVASIVFLNAMSPDVDAGIGTRFFDGLGADPVLGALASMGTATAGDEAWMRARVARALERAPERPDSGTRHQEAAFRLGWRQLADLAAIDAPTLVVHGEADLVMPTAHARSLVAGVSGARLQLVAGMAHLPNREEWALVADLVARHVLAAAAVAR